MLLAGRKDSPQSRQALDELCRHYWYPVYAFLRRQTHNHQDASDLVQGFFQYLQERELIGKANPERGRFRNFLLGVLKNFVRGEQEKKNAICRGGGTEIVSIDEETAEGRYAFEPANSLSPEKLFDLHWALNVLAQALERLEAEYERLKKKDDFIELKPYLTGDDADSFAKLSTRLNKSEGAARLVVHRFRERYRHYIRTVIADPVSDLEQVERAGNLPRIISAFSLNLAGTDIVRRPQSFYPPLPWDLMRNRYGKKQFPSGEQQDG